MSSKDRYTDTRGLEVPLKPEPITCDECGIQIQIVHGEETSLDCWREDGGHCPLEDRIGGYDGEPEELNFHIDDGVIDYE